jgi:predicted nucleotidyltransferase
MNRKLEHVLIATNAQKILNYLSLNPGKKYLSREIQGATRVSRAGANLALRSLVKSGYVQREKRGSVFLYSIDFKSPLIKQLKVLQSIIHLSSLIKALEPYAKKIILYGSASRGEGTEDSDVDLFVVTNAPEAVQRIVDDTSKERNIQLILRTPVKYVEMQTKDPTFLSEVEQGIVLWESGDES